MFSACRSRKRRLDWDNANPVALMTLGQDELNQSSEPHLRAGAEYAARLIERDPLAPGALSLYGFALDRLGETERAERAMRVAAAHLPIDVTAHAWLYEHALRRGDLAGSFAELDVLLRGRPFLLAQIGPSLLILLGTGAAAEAGFHTPSRD